MISTSYRIIITSKKIPELFDVITVAQSRELLHGNISRLEKKLNTFHIKMPVLK